MHVFLKVKCKNKNFVLNKPKHFNTRRKINYNYNILIVQFLRKFHNFGNTGTFTLAPDVLADDDDELTRPTPFHIIK